MSCTIASGITASCKQAGGISKLYLASYPDNLVVTPARAIGGKVTDIDSGITALTFYEFVLQEGTAYMNEKTIGEVTLGFEKTCGGTLLDYSEANNVLLDPILRGRSIAIAIDNNGKAFMQGDVNALRSMPADGGISAGVDGSHGYTIALGCKDGVPMREIDYTKIVFGTGSITVQSA